MRARPDRSFAYSGETLLVVNRAGAITGTGDEGLYVQNTRLVCRQVLTVNGRVPRPIAVSPVGGNGMLAYAEVAEGPGIPAHTIYLETARMLGTGTHGHSGGERTARCRIRAQRA